MTYLYGKRLPEWVKENNLFLKDLVDQEDLEDQGDLSPLGDLCPPFLLSIKNRHM